MALDISTETLNARRQCIHVTKILNKNDFQLNLLYLAKLSIKGKGNIKFFRDASMKKKTNLFMHNYSENYQKRSFNKME